MIIVCCPPPPEARPSPPSEADSPSKWTLTNVVNNQQREEGLQDKITLLRAVEKADSTIDLCKWFIYWGEPERAPPGLSSGSSVYIYGTSRTSRLTRMVVVLVTDGFPTRMVQ